MAAPFRLLFGLPKIPELFATTGIVLKGIQKKIMAVKRNLDQVGRIAQMTFVELTKYKRHQQKYNERRREATERLRKHLTTVWKALENGESVNGYTTKETWAKHFFNPTASHPERWIQKIVANKPKGTNSVRVVKVERDMILQFGKRKFKLVSMGQRFADVPYEDEAGFETVAAGAGDEVTNTLQLNLKELDPPKPSQKERLQAAKKFKHGIDPATFGPVHKARTLCGLPVKPLETANLHDAKHITCPECTPHIEEANAKCREILEATCHAVHQNAKNRKTHQMQPNDRRTWCGKTVGDTLPKDAPMSDEPSCKQCQWGKGMDKLRKEHRSALHPAAEALAATVDGAAVPYDKEAYAKAKNWAQKVCITGSPENLEHAKALQYRREHPSIDPNEGDEFAGEGD
jgi:Sec-independent protein translocase protein TatA